MQWFSSTIRFYGCLNTNPNEKINNKYLNSEFNPMIIASGTRCDGKFKGWKIMLNLLRKRVAVVVAFASAVTVTVEPEPWYVIRMQSLNGCDYRTIGNIIN